MHQAKLYAGWRGEHRDFHQRLGRLREAEGCLAYLEYAIVLLGVDDKQAKSLPEGITVVRRTNNVDE